jgi:hypothetical protein
LKSNRRDKKNYRKAKQVINMRLHAAKARMNAQLAQIMAKINNIYAEEQFYQSMGGRVRKLQPRWNNQQMFNNKSISRMHTRALQIPRHKFNIQNKIQNHMIPRGHTNFRYHQPEEDTDSRLNFNHLQNAQPNTSQVFFDRESGIDKLGNLNGYNINDYIKHNGRIYTTKSTTGVY